MESLAPADDPLLARALVTAEQAWHRGDLAAALKILHLALFRAEGRGDRYGALGARQLLGHLAFQVGDYRLAEAYHWTVLVQSRALGLNLGRASALHNLGILAAVTGRRARARRLLLVAVARYERLGKADVAYTARANMALFEATWKRSDASGQRDESA